MLLAGCTSPEPVTLNFPHDWSSRPDELAKRAELSQRFTRETGIHVRDIPTPESTFDQLALYRELLRQGSSGADLLGIDLIWTDLLEPDLIDLQSYLPAEISFVVPQLLPGYTVGRKVVGIPYQVNIGSLEYRTDLLREYGYDHPPETWDELEAMAKRIQTGERAKGKKDFWGFVWQGAEAEALTCNALEWQIAEGGGRIVESDRTISVNNPAAIRAWQRARHWVGWISTPSVIAYRERDSMNVFDSGGAAFDLAGDKHCSERALQPNLLAKSGAARDDGFYQRAWRPRRVGWHLGRSRFGGFPVFGLSPRSCQTGSIPTSRTSRVDRGARQRFWRPGRILHHNAGLRPLLKLIHQASIVHRPSIETGSQYTQVSAAYARTVHAVLARQKEAPEAAAELEKQLMQITGFRAGLPRKGN
jgi:trehalose/maltose transport system substrate-binding protein